MSDFCAQLDPTDLFAHVNLSLVVVCPVVISFYFFYFICSYYLIYYYYYYYFIVMRVSEALPSLQCLLITDRRSGNFIDFSRVDNINSLHPYSDFCAHLDWTDLFAHPGLDLFVSAVWRGVFGLKETTRRSKRRRQQDYFFSNPERERTT